MFKYNLDWFHLNLIYQYITLFYIDTNILKKSICEINIKGNLYSKRTDSLMGI
jgi:hypothetical protein